MLASVPIALEDAPLWLRRVGMDHTPKLIILDFINLAWAADGSAQDFSFLIWPTIVFAWALLQTCLEPSNLFSLFLFPLNLDFASLILAGTAIKKCPTFRNCNFATSILARAHKRSAHTYDFLPK